MIDHKLLQQARAGIQKHAFAPTTPEAQAAAAGGAAPGGAPVDPAMMAGGGAPVDPAMAGMDPAMMAGGGAPPVDPAMAGMDPAMAGMDPAMMGMDPAMMGMDPAMAGGEPPAGTPVTLNLEDLQAVVAELAGGAAKPEKEGGRATNKEIMGELQGVKDSIAALAAAMGVQMPAGQVGAGGDMSATATPGEPEDLDAAAAQLAATELSGAPGFSEMDAGLPPGEALPKTAAALTDWSKTKIGQ